MTDKFPKIVRTGKVYEVDNQKWLVRKQTFDKRWFIKWQNPFVDYPEEYIPSQFYLLPTILIVHGKRWFDIRFSFIGLHIGVNVHHIVEVQLQS